MTLRRRQVDTAATCVDLSRTAKVSQVDAAATRGNLYLSAALLDFNAAATGLNGGALRSGLNFDAATTRRGDDLPVGVMPCNGAATRAQTDIAADRAYVDRTAAGFHVDSSADVVEVHTAAPARGVDAARNSYGVHVATLGLEFYPSHFAWNANGELAGQLLWVPTLPVAHDPGCVSANVCADFVGLELAACVLLRGRKRAGMNHIIDALLLSPVHDHRAHVYFDPQVFYSSQGTRNFLGPRAALPGYMRFLRQRQRRKQGQHASQPDEL